ncbi:MAG: malonic semialdehyde reductase [Microbacteriaceae bacterium]|nr:malonic semialdehyde reductase [Microbacteriaceae bacterium]
MSETLTATTIESGGANESARSAIFTNARTANSFAATPVTDAQLVAVWELAKWAPTAINSQPLRVLYVTSAEGRENLARHLSRGNRAKTLAAPAVAILAYDSDFHEQLPLVMPVMAGMRDVLAADDAKRGQMAQFNATLQAGYFVLAARSLGLAAGPMAGFDAETLDAEFFSGTSWKSILVVNLGYAAGDSFRDRQPRLEHSEVIRFI